MIVMLRRDGEGVKVLAFNQCGPGSIAAIGVRLSLLLVLVLAPRVFFCGSYDFSFLLKTIISKYHTDLDFKCHRIVSRKTVKYHPR